MAHRRAFSLPEALAALALTGLAASALLLASYSALAQTASTRDHALAQGLAQQMLDEILEHPFTVSPAWQAARGDFETPIGGVHADARLAFQTLDDYDGYVTERPIRDAAGYPWGRGDVAGQPRHSSFALPADYFSGWRLAVRVRPVADVNLQAALAVGTASPLRRIEVTVSKLVDGQSVPIVTASRVVAEMAP